MYIFLAVVVTFAVTSLWSRHANNANKKSLEMTLSAALNEMNDLSEKLGYQDIEDYWQKEKGQAYAETAAANFMNAMESLK